VQHGQRQRGVVPVLLPDGAGEVCEESVHACLGGARPDVQAMNVTCGAGPHIVAGAPEHQQRITALRTDRRQRREPSAIAAVGCGRQQEHVRRAGREHRCRVVPIAVARNAVRFVDDDDVPPRRGNRGRDFGALDVVH
jgi:hypothetical protein